MIALDLDGTLFNNDKKINEIDKDALRKAVSNGIEVVISTGRPYVGLPVDELAKLGIRYAITVNGAAIYTIPDKKLIYENVMDSEEASEIAKALHEFEIYSDIFVDGNGYGNEDKKHIIDNIDMSDSMKAYIRNTRSFFPDVAEYIRQEKVSVQKITVDFIKRDGKLLEYDEVRAALDKFPNITYVSGGNSNLEITRKGTTKAAGLRFLADMLSIPMEKTMACGDSENDADIIKTAAIGVAMANSEPIVKEIADYVTASNEEGGVAKAIEMYINKMNKF